MAKAGTIELDRTHDIQRMCVVTRQRHDPSSLLRFVVNPQGEIVPDISQKLPGRGVWVLANPETLKSAVEGKALISGFRDESGLKINADTRLSLAYLEKNVKDLLRQDARRVLSLANKSGAIVQGYAKVEQALLFAKVIGLIFARDGSADGKRKVLQIAHRSAENGANAARGLEKFGTIFDSSELDMALGRTNVIHVAVLNCGAGEALLQRARKLAAFCDEVCSPLEKSLE